MKLKSFLAMLALSLASFGVSAQVDESEVTSFSAGSPAKASEMNATIQALITAINDNSERITALEQSAGMSNSVSGRTYQYHNFGVIFIGGPGTGDNVGYGSVSAGNFLAQGTVSFNANGTVAVSGLNYEGEIGMNDGESYQSGEIPETEMISGTWTQDGSELSILFEGEEEAASLVISKDGRVLVLSEFYNYRDTDACANCQRSESSLLVAVEM